MSDQEHFPTLIYYDGFGMGWRIECNCGEVTCPRNTIEEAGAEMDDHMAPVEETV